MIRVLVVEDEPPIARAVVQRIEQFSELFSVVSSAINGQIALEILAENEIDVVFTDIRMPVMDGIALLQQIHILYPDIITIVLSGYQDFSYAQSALRYGAYDYLLKPISPKNMEELLNRLLTVCGDRIYQKKITQLQGIIRGNAPQKADFPDCTVMLIVAGAFPMFVDDALIPGSIFWEGVDLEKMLSPLLTGKESQLVFDGKLKSEKIVIMEYLSKDRAHEIVKELFNRLTGVGGIHITLLGYPEPLPFSQVGPVISQLRLRQYAVTKLCKSQLVWEHPKSRGKDGRTVNLSEFPVNKIVEAICIQDMEKLAASVSDSLSMAEECGLTQLEFQQYLDMIINDSRLISSQLAPSASAVKMDMDIAVANAVTFEQLGNEMMSVFAALGQGATTAGQKDQAEVVREIEQFLLANYGKSVSNELLSRKFGFVPSYISKIFRKFKGVTPSEYLTSYRIQMAKQMICKQPASRIRDIAQLVGYDDQYYFSKIFKKETGIWPKQYQDECKLPVQ